MASPKAPIVRPTRAEKRYLIGGRFVGRPPKLFADEKTLRQVIGLGKIMCTTREIAGVLGVSHDTLMEFFNDCPEARAAYENAKEVGKMSLRRAQIEGALKGNPTLLIWAGKQYLGQTDRAEVTGTLSLEQLILGAEAIVRGPALPYDDEELSEGAARGPMPSP